MKEFNYTAVLVNGDEVRRVTRTFSQQLNKQQLEMLDKDINKTYPEYKLTKYELEIKDIKES